MILAAVVMAMATGACGSATPTRDGAATPAPVSPSLATSVETTAGSWAVLPMGHLDQPLNTFWQLFFRRRGASAWSDLASDLAVATNGGLVLATSSQKDLAVGVRPANLLEFSPLLVTSDAGHSWTPANPVAALANQPDSLAIGTGGGALALTTTANGEQEVLESPGQLTDWHELTTSTQLGASAGGRSCGLGSLTAVGMGAATPLVAASCRRPGIVGIFSEAQTGWELAGPTLSPSLGAGSVDVIGLLPTAGGVCALLVVSIGHTTGLLAAWRSGGGTAWTTSSVLALGSRQVESFGPDGGAGFFLLAASEGGPDSVEVMSGPGASWRGLPSPPVHTETLVFAPTGRVDALAADDTIFTDWTLQAASASWSRSQVVNVPVQFGSSS